MLFPKKRIYLDHAAATPLRKEVFSAMRPYFIDHFGNPSSIHKEGSIAREAIEKARADSAQILGAHPDEIYFTSGGTEANQLAFSGYSGDGTQAPTHIVTTALEHPSVLEVARLHSHVIIKVNHEGLVNPKDIYAALTPETRLVSVMYVNNEVGSVQPLPEIAKVIRRFRKENNTSYPLFHTDASQAPCTLPCKVTKLGVDLMTLDAQKIYGPKGVGALYARRGVSVTPLMHGGGQERGVRPGTENTPLIIGFARALYYADQEQEREKERLSKLRDHFFAEVTKHIPSAVINGGREDRVASNVNISIPGFESEFMVLWLDAHGVSCGARSACMGSDGEHSYVLSSLGATDEVAQSSLRFSLGKDTTRKDIDRTVALLSEMVQKLTR